MPEPGFHDPTLPPEMQERLGDKSWNLLPGFDGVPYRSRTGAVPIVKEDDPAHIRPQLQNDIKIKVFDLGDEEQLAEYTKVLNMCAQALGRVMDQDRQYDKITGAWKVLLTWATYFYEDPAETKRERRKFYD